MLEPDQYADFFKARKKVYLIGGGIIFCLIVGLWWWRVYLWPYQSTDDASIDGVEVSVSAEMPGRIAQFLVDEGSYVKAGDLLFVLDDQLLQAQKKRAEAMVQNAIDQVALQRVKVELSFQDYMRARKEFEDKVISPEAMDHFEKGLEAARAELQTMFSAVLVQEANLKMIETQIRKTYVYATCDGMIGKRWHFPGDVVQEGQTVFTLFDLSNIWVTANLEETKVASVCFNNPVEISVDAYSDLKFRGVVEVVGAGAASQFSLIPPNNASGNFTKVTQRVPIRISIETPPMGNSLYLRPGMSVEVKIKTR